MSQVLEFYPSTHGCIQGCFHCPRGISAPRDESVKDIANRQRELARNVLFCFSEQEESLSALNLSGYIGEYDFQLFDDIGGMGLNQIYFNLGTFHKKSLGLIEENIQRVGNILPINTGSKDIDIFGNLQHVAGGKEMLDRELLGGFVTSFFSALKTEIPISDKIFTGLMIASNNISERNLRDFDIMEILSAFVSSHKLLGEASVSSARFTDFSEEGLNLVRSDRVIDKKQTRIDFRGIQAKKSKKAVFLDELKTSLGCEELTVSVFPDTVMVYHSTWNMHIEELFFTYDEFEQILKDFVCQTGTERVTLKRIIDERLIERAHKSGLISE